MIHRKAEIERLGRQQIEAYLRRSSLTYLECCISLMLTHMTREEVAEILEAQAHMIRELG